MNLSQRTADFVKMGQLFGALSDHEYQRVESFVGKKEWDKWQNAIQRTEVINPWFTQENIKLSLKGLSGMLEESKIVDWLSKYHENLQEIGSKKVGVIMAGNIPLVGFHDFLCVLISGHYLLAKLSSDDNVLFPMIREQLIIWNEDWNDRIAFLDEKMKGHQAVIATGSNNTSRYFDYYFKDVPKIIRKNRSGVAILDGNESHEELKALGKDIFQYFGLGCRNISKLFLPRGYNLNKIYEGIYEFNEVINHNKYCNNYDYYRAIYLLNQFEFLDNNFLLLKEQEADIASPLGVLYYEYYDNRSELMELLEKREDEVQCIISRELIPFGQSQFPELWDYADGVDTMDFLSEL